jgi:hypothetical protein
VDLREEFQGEPPEGVTEYGAEHSRGNRTQP